MKTLYQKLEERVRRQARKAASPSFNLDKIRQAVVSDPTLNAGQQQSLLQSLSDPNFIAELKEGAVGGALGYLISKYLNLKPETRILASIAGFGIGKVLYDYSKDPKQFSTYNPRTKMQEIKDYDSY